MGSIGESRPQRIDEPAPDGGKNHHRGVGAAHCITEQNWQAQQQAIGSVAESQRNTRRHSGPVADAAQPATEGVKQQRLSRRQVRGRQPQRHAGRPQPAPKHLQPARRHRTLKPSGAAPRGRCSRRDPHPVQPENFSRVPAELSFQSADGDEFRDSLPRRVRFDAAVYNDEFECRTVSRSTWSCDRARPISKASFANISTLAFNPDFTAAKDRHSRCIRRAGV